MKTVNLLSIIAIICIAILNQNLLNRKQAVIQSYEERAKSADILIAAQQKEIDFYRSQVSSRDSVINEYNKMMSEFIEEVSKIK